MSNLWGHLSKYTDWIPSAFNLLTSDLLRSKYKNFLREEMARIEYYSTSKRPPFPLGPYSVMKQYQHSYHTYTVTSHSVTFNLNKLLSPFQSMILWYLWTCCWNMVEVDGWLNELSRNAISEYTIPAEVRTDQEFESNKRNTAKDGAAQKLLERWKA